MERKKHIYLDYNGTSPLRDEVAEEYISVLSLGNPSSVHWAGREARDAIDTAREKIAHILGVNPHEIVFTSGGTEGNNTAVKGITFEEIKKGKTPFIISTRVEHSSVLRPLEFLRELGAKVELIGVDSYGVPDPDDFRKAIKKNGCPSLISVMYVNNETGCVLPVPDIVKVVREEVGYDTLIHTDIVQAVGKIPIDLRELDIDFASFSGHKIYSPKGIGVLFVRRGIDFSPLLHGGKQEDGIRAGTQNVAGAVAIAKALEIVVKEMKEEMKRLREIQRKFEEMVEEEIPDTKINGHPELRIPTTSNILFRGVEGETLLISLDFEGIAVSMGSACSAETKSPSHVLMAMGLSREEAQSSIRFSFGKFTTEEDIIYTVEKLKEIVPRIKRRRYK